MPWRSVSWTPGAEGADEVVVTWVVALEASGTMRIDCDG